MKKDQSNEVNFQKFVNKDGFSKGGVEIEMSKPTETQTQKVRGQKRMLSEKQRTAKWY
jgi:hypothetical protein